jgi:hypothetical protein
MHRWVIVMSLLAASPLMACEDEVRCERARLDLDKTWGELRLAATHRVLEGVDVPSWMDIEKKVELLESSFMTRQVTWESADKATHELASKLPVLHTDQEAQLVSFRNSAESAIKQQGSFEKECR